MVAQATATKTRQPRTRKPTIVEVQPYDLHAGLWAALSSDQSTWYLLDLRERTCSCPAGERHFERCKKDACKHLIACRVWARSLASMTPAARAQALRFGHVRVNVDKVDLAALDAPLAPPTAAPVALPAAA